MEVRNSGDSVEHERGPAVFVHSIRASLQYAMTSQRGHVLGEAIDDGKGVSVSVNEAKL